ncbi:MAG TPA: helix-turn-helix domain-containing protein, partial [Myxococcota bacterium]|nr:helix-turn-helix domain-containing protein [Myxococcota bacterium]
MKRRRKAQASRPRQAERRTLSARRLLDAATQLIAEQGFSRTTLAQIGEKAGYSRGLVNERFGSKSELVRVLAGEFQTYFAHDRLEPALAHKRGL